MANNLASNTGWPPLLGSSNAMLGLIFVGASVMVLTLIPKVAEIIKGAISGRPFAYGSAIGEAWGPVRGLYGSTVGSQVEAMQKYGNERGAQELFRNLDTWMSSQGRGGGSWVPQRLKDYVGRVSGRNSER